MLIQLLRVALAAAAAVLGSSHVLATETSTYQGRLELDGAPYNGEIDITFQTFPAANGGLALSDPSEVFGVVVTDGLFSAEFTYQEEGLVREDVWLQISVKPTGSAGPFEILTPRQKITSAPRAQQAAGAALLTNGDVVFSSRDTTIFGLLVCCNSETVITAPGFTQTFVAQDVGLLNEISTGAMFALGDQMNLEIYEGATATGVPIASGSSNAAVAVQLDTPIQLTLGETYTMQMQVVDTATGLAGGANFRVEQGDVYPAGESSFGADLDAVFQLILLRPIAPEAFVSNGGFNADGFSRLDDTRVDGLLDVNGPLDLRGQMDIFGNVVVSSIAGGNSSVTLPSSSIGPPEMFAEPGVASAGVSSGIPSLSTATTDPVVLSSRTITVPESGYVVAIATVSPNLNHVNGNTSTYDIGLSRSSTTFTDGSQDVSLVLSGNTPTGTYRIPTTVSGVFLSSPGMQTVYLLGKKNSTTAPTLSFNDLSLTLMYFPTSYGTVTTTLGPDLGLGAAAAPDDANALYRPYTAEELEMERQESVRTVREREAIERKAIPKGPGPR
ncbi:MAG: hypothetical protein AAGB51_13185 [Planctomycetota bacterium]